MVAILEKGEFNIDFHPMVDFIAVSPLRMGQFGQITHSHQYVVPFHTKKLFTTLRVNSPSFSGKIVPLFNTMLVHQGEGSGTPTEPHHTPSPAADTSHPTTSSIPLPSLHTAPIPPVTQTNTTPIREGEACPTESGFIADQDRATIAKSSTLPYDSAPRAQDVEILRLKERVQVLEDRESVAAKQSGDDAPIKRRSINEGEAAAKRICDDSEELERVLTSIYIAKVLAGGIDVPTGSGSIPNVGPPAADIFIGSKVAPTASLIVTSYSRRKGKEVMVESDTPKKQRLQEQIDAQVSRELEEQQEKEDMRMNEQIARDAEVARIHAREELQGMIDSLDRTNETIAKYMQEYQEFASELPLEKKIELISDLVKYQENYSKVYKLQSQQRRPMTKKQNRDYYMTMIRNNLGWKEEAKRIKRKWFNLEQEHVKKTSGEAPEIEKSTEEIPKEKMKEMMQLEEFTQSIHTFIEDKRNMAQHTHGKKKATLIVIPSIRFTKLIIYHLQRKHKFYPRLDSSLHLPNEEPVLRYLKFSAKETKREFFGMPIPGSLITVDIQGASYYQEYLGKVAKHKRYLASETGSDLDSPALKPTKIAKKSKPTAPKADPRPPVSKPASSKQPEPKLAPAKTQGKKYKLTIKISEKPSKAKKSIPGSVLKRRKPISSLRSIDESVTEDVPEKEPRVDDEEADVQRALEESLKSMYDVPQGPLPPVTPKKKSPADRYIFQRHTSTPTGSFGHDESSSLYAELGLTDNKEESKKDVPWADSGVQGKAQAGPDPGAQNKGQAGSNPDEQAEGQAGLDPSNAEASQPLPIPVVHVGSDLEHMDLDVADVSTQPLPEQMDEGFTATAYPNVQENLKLTVEEQMILEEPASSLGTLSSLQHLIKDLSFGDLFFSDKPSKANNEKATAETEAESMVFVTIQHDTSSIPLMTTQIIDLTSRPDHGACLYTLEQLDIPHHVSKAVDEVFIDAVDSAMQAPLWNYFRDLPEVDMKEILHQCMWETDSYKTHKDHTQLYEALEKSMNRDHSEELAKDLAKARKKKKKSRESPKMLPGSPHHQPPPHPLPASSSRASGSLRASRSSQVPPPPPPPPSTNQKVQSSDDEDIENDHIPKVNLQQDWWKPLEEERPATPEPAWSIPSSDVPVPANNWASTLASTYSPPPEDSLLAQTGNIAMFMDWFCKRRGITELKPQDLEGPVFEIIKVFYPNLIHLQYQMEECNKLLTDSVDDSILRHNVRKPLPLGGPSGQVTIQSEFFFNKDLEYLRYGSKGSRPALSISKMKAAYYPDIGLEQMVPDQMWIEEECKYDIAAMYGISHWWFQRQRFYIDRHTSEGDCRAVRTHMRILSFVRIEVFSKYGYDYMKKTVLRRTDLNEHVIAERDFKYLYLSDFEDMYLLNLQGHLNHLPPKDKKILTIAANLWTRHLVIRQRDRYGVWMIMHFNEIHKFSIGTLQQIDEALDYRVKEFKINRMNPSLNTRFWTKKDVDRSKEFMFAIQK
uniref:E-beta-farnesene synthase n=1 Tax=Tanacetum cinerariifolium TaxID=118510 RepID=A0A6L2NI19_TANCI|nr:hypothetical protein [Tanacetum cinerariifolium]